MSRANAFRAGPKPRPHERMQSAKIRPSTLVISDPARSPSTRYCDNTDGTDLIRIAFKAAAIFCTFSAVTGHGAKYHNSKQRR